MSTTSTPTMTVQIPLEEFEPLGARPNDGLVITDVQEGSPASGNLRVGDTILSVNGRKISNLKSFYQIMGIAHPTATIEIRRPRTNEELPPEVRTDPSDNLPVEIRSAITRRNGYHYSLVTIDRVPGLRLGLSIKTRDNRVWVTEVKDGSMCSPHLKVFDHIVYVSGVRVTQADVAQTLLVKSMKENSRVDVVIGRPTSRQAIAAANIALSQEDAHDPPSVRLNVDVQQVMRQQILNMAALAQVQPAGVLRNGPTPPQPNNRRITFTGNNEIVPIQSDNVGRQLRRVTAGIPNSPIRQS
ncbi:PDZ domain-containing protein [Meloidogyne graminicola]|uniref:PDZ domain-containing protein n=2 Tax=Meloidogyne graminicola TaxID=189291 RepID=A0A8S9ZY13_9BILA|nr:PDZ domain-containing protein [Meloidogyne graminicola]